MRKTLVSVAVAALFVATVVACKQGLGDRCQLDSDCEDGLICNVQFDDNAVSADGLCANPEQVDAGPDEGGQDAEPPRDTPEDTPDAADAGDAGDAGADALDGGVDADMKADAPDAVDMPADAPDGADLPDAPLDAPVDAPVDAPADASDAVVGDLLGDALPDPMNG